MLKIFTVDAFTDKMFSGNPAGVCLLGERNIDDSLMQSIACEMNLSETAFVKKVDKDFSLRWFTPKVEVELCGHATLASSHILWQEGILRDDEEAVFQTVYRGKLTAHKSGDNIILDFPVNIAIPEGKNSEVERALNIIPKEIYSTKDHYVVELNSEDEVRKLKPDLFLVSRLPKFGTIVTAKAVTKGYDFVSRFFAPAKGVDEDPVTGSAHCVLAPYWGSRLGKKTMNAYQASERGGSMVVEIKDERVLMKGKAVTVIDGNLFI